MPIICIAAPLRILAKQNLGPACAQVSASLQKLALEQVLLVLGSNEQDAGSIAAEQNWKKAFTYIVQLVLQKVHPEFEPLLPQGMSWKQIEAVLETELGQVESLIDFTSKVNSPEELERFCLARIVVLAVNQTAKMSRIQLSATEMERVIQLLDVLQIKAMMNDPASFFESLWEEDNKVAGSLALELLRPMIEDKMPDIEWKDMERLVQQMDSPELRAAFADPTGPWAPNEGTSLRAMFFFGRRQIGGPVGPWHPSCVGLGFNPGGGATPPLQLR